MINKETTKWHCVDCHADFQGPRDRTPENGCEAEGLLTRSNYGIIKTNGQTNYKLCHDALKYSYDW